MKHTIIMSGGLGNQMFQYAFYLSMKAKGKNVRLMIHYSILLKCIMVSN